MEQEEYCPNLNNCIQTRKEICYSPDYQKCLSYRIKTTIETIQETEKGLTKKVSEKLGNPNDKNSLQL